MLQSHIVRLCFERRRGQDLRSREFPHCEPTTCIVSVGLFQRAGWCQARMNEVIALIHYHPCNTLLRGQLSHRRQQAQCPVRRRPHSAPIVTGKLHTMPRHSPVSPSSQPTSLSHCIRTRATRSVTAIAQCDKLATVIGRTKLTKGCDDRHALAELF